MAFLTTAGSVPSIRVSLKQVQHGEQENPHQVDEVPVQPGVLDAIRVLLRIALPELRARPYQVGHDDDAPQDMETVQPRQREIDCEEGAVPRPFAAREVRGILE